VPLTPIPPPVFRKILELDGFELVAEDRNAWILECNKQPLVVPKNRDFLAAEIMEELLERAGIRERKYEELLAHAMHNMGIIQLPQLPQLPKREEIQPPSPEA